MVGSIVEDQLLLDQLSFDPLSLVLDPLWLDPLSLHPLSLDSYLLLLNPLSNSHFLNVTFNTAGLLEAEEGQGAVLEEEAEAPRLPLPPRGSCGGGRAVLIRQEMEVSWREECGGFLLFSSGFTLLQ